MAEVTTGRELFVSDVILTVHHAKEDEIHRVHPVTPDAILLVILDTGVLVHRYAKLDTLLVRMRT